MVLYLQQSSVKVRELLVRCGQKQPFGNVSGACYQNVHLALLICLRCVATWDFTHPSVKPEQNLALWDILQSRPFAHFSMGLETTEMVLH